MAILTLVDDRMDPGFGYLGQQENGFVRVVTLDALRALAFDMQEFVMLASIDLGKRVRTRGKLPVTEEAPFECILPGHHGRLVGNRRVLLPVEGDMNVPRAMTIFAFYIVMDIFIVKFEKILMAFSADSIPLVNRLLFHYLVEDAGADMTRFAENPSA